MIVLIKALLRARKSCQFLHPSYIVEERTTLWRGRKGVKGEDEGRGSEGMKGEGRLDKKKRMG